ncbi:MAG: helix-turn-helix domain-containing protein [Pseudomonadota bacterium]
MTNPSLLTVEQVADRLHETVSVKAVRALIRSGALPYRKIGRRYYIEESALRRFMRCQGNASRRGSTTAPTPATGLSETAPKPYGQGLAEMAVEKLLKPRSDATSPSGRPKGKGQPSPTKLHAVKS